MAKSQKIKKQEKTASLWKLHPFLWYEYITQQRVPYFNNPLLTYMQTPLAHSSNLLTLIWSDTPKHTYTAAPAVIEALSQLAPTN